MLPSATARLAAGVVALAVPRRMMRARFFVTLARRGCPSRRLVYGWLERVLKCPRRPRWGPLLRADLVGR